MSAFILFDNLEVRDATLLARYKACAAAVVRAYQGRYVVLGGPSEILEGSWAPSFPVMLEFPSAELARAFYRSDDYRALKDMRLRAVRSSAVLLEGIEPEDLGPVRSS